MEIKIVEFLENEGEQTLRRQLPYIKKETAHIEEQPEVLKWVINEGLLPSGDAVNLYNKVCSTIASHQERCADLQESQSRNQDEEAASREKTISRYFITDIVCSAFSLLFTLAAFGFSIATFFADAPLILSICLLVYFTLAAILATKGLLGALNGKKHAHELAHKVVEKEFQENEELLADLTEEIEELYNCTTLLEWYTDRNGLPIKNVSGAPERILPIIS